ncbi:MAG: glycerol-3-phosphate acyltransferase [Chloroflexi bacterium]|nr:glycerol-3-phosphate acyltransferase [Chloroflexota bacterium]
MDTAGHVLAMLGIGYLLGSVPFARLITMWSGVDLFSVGTGNPGAANVFRKVDKRLGAAVFFADVLKGTVPVVIAWAVGAPQDLWVVAGGAAIVGHWYPIFNRFRGGAGLATGAGVAIALMPLAGLIGLAVGLLTIVRFKSSGHGALVGLVVMVGLWFLISADWPVGSEWPAVVGTAALAAVLLGKAAIKGWKPGRKD